MTRLEKIAFVRDKCIEVNSEMGMRVCNANEKHTGVHTGYCPNGHFFGDYPQKYRDAHLADVLLAIDKKTGDISIGTDGRFVSKTKDWVTYGGKFAVTWNLRKTLEDQDHPTISFLYDVLKR